MPSRQLLPGRISLRRQVSPVDALVGLGSSRSCTVACESAPRSASESPPGPPRRACHRALTFRTMRPARSCECSLR